MYYTCKNVKKSYKNNKFKISAPSRYEEFELPNGSCSISDIQDYFEYIYIYIYIYKEHNEKLLKRIYINKIENRIKFKIKTGCYLELLTPETMELLKSTN